MGTYNIPQNIKHSLDNYVNNKIPPGGFLYAVLSNDLFIAMQKADEWSRASLFDICSYIYNELPMNCYGSEITVKEWLGQ